MSWLHGPLVASTVCQVMKFAALNSTELPAPGSNPLLAPVAVPVMVISLGVPPWTVIDGLTAAPVYWMSPVFVNVPPSIVITIGVALVNVPVLVKSTGSTTRLPPVDALATVTPLATFMLPPPVDAAVRLTLADPAFNVTFPVALAPVNEKLRFVVELVPTVITPPELVIVNGVVARGV